MLKLLCSENIDQDFLEELNFVYFYFNFFLVEPQSLKKNTVILQLQWAVMNILTESK
jgi:hypothetical protein